MTRRALVAAAAAGLLLAACGETTVDTSITRPDPAGTVAATAPATVDVALPLPDLVVAMQDEFRGLDEQIVDGDGDEETLARILAIWDVAESQVQDEFPDLLFGFQQAIALAETGVERRRPADASKGELLLGPLVDELLAG